MTTADTLTAIPTARFMVRDHANLCAAIETFIHTEVKLLDERRFDEWIALFSEDGFYWAPTVPGQKDPLNTASLFYDDIHAMKARFARLRHPRIHVQTPPSRTSHLVSGILVEKDDVPDQYVVHSSFLMLEYRPGQEQRLYGGKFLYRLRHEQDRFLMLMKRAELVNCDASFTAMAIPF